MRLRSLAAGVDSPGGSRGLTRTLALTALALRALAESCVPFPRALLPPPAPPPRRSGFIDRDELSRLLSKVGIAGGMAERILKSVDADGDGQISFEEFTALFSALH